MKTETKKLAEALDVLAREIQSEDGVANAAIQEAAQRLRELDARLGGDESALQKLLTSQTELIDRLGNERNNWERTAAQYHDGVEYYRGLVVKIGEQFGAAAKTCDDGSLSEDVLCAKVPEVVGAELGKLRGEIQALERDCRAFAEKTGLVPLARFQELAEIGQKQANEFDRYWAAAGVLDAKVTVDDAIAQYQALKNRATNAEAIIGNLRELVTVDHESKADLVGRVRAVLEWVPAGAKADEPVSPCCGVLIRAGTFVAGGEEVTGYLISSTREELAAVTRLPMYKRVQLRAEEKA